MGVCVSRPKANEDLAAKKKNHRRRRRRILRRRVSSSKIEANNVAHSNSALQASNRASGASASMLLKFEFIVLLYLKEKLDTVV